MSKTIILLITITITAFNFTCAEANQKEFMPFDYVSSIGGDELYNKVKGIDYFSNMDKGNEGSPVALLITKENKHTAGGTAASLTSILLAGSTLGLVPVVENKDLSITYKVIVHRNSVREYTYTENFTDAKSFYNLADNALEGDALEWALSTVEQFQKDIKGDLMLETLLADYRYYFSE